MDNNSLKIQGEMLQGDDIVKPKEESPKSIRDNLYGNIDVSVKTMDKVIIGLFVALGLALICGVIR